MPEKKKPIKYRLLNYGRYFIKEIIPVTIGILIALSIGNWNQNIKEQKYVTEMLGLIDNELKATDKSIEDVIPLQESLIDTLQHYSNNKDVSIMQTILNVGGVKIASIKTNAWNAISNSKLELVDYKLIIPLSDIVEEKEVLKVKGNTLINFANENLNETNTEKKKILILYLKDIIGTEKAIQKQIKAVKNLK
jgi:hypothetical protein|tara:strand:- start:156 stop:734 length:579 start_codon:yes stop_codon:yes gene_type:complete